MKDWQLKTGEEVRRVKRGLAPMGYDIVHDLEDFGLAIGTEECNACLTEVKESFEGRRCCKMSATMHDTFALIAYPLNTAFDMLFEDINTPLQ